MAPRNDRRRRQRRYSRHRRRRRRRRRPFVVLSRLPRRDRWHAPRAAILSGLVSIPRRNRRPPRSRLLPFTPAGDSAHRSRRLVVVNGVVVVSKRDRSKAQPPLRQWISRFARKLSRAALIGRDALGEKGEEGRGSWEEIGREDGGREGRKRMDDWTLPVTGERASDARYEDPKETPTRIRPEDADYWGWEM